MRERVMTGFAGLGSALALLACAGCAASGGAAAHFAGTGPAAETPFGPPSHASTGLFGAYLAGRVAQEDQDFPAALAYYEEALARAPGDPELTNRVFVLAATEGRFDLARKLAATLVAADPTAPLANLVVAIDQLERNHPAEALAAARRLPDDGFYRFVGSFARAWLTQAAKGGAVAAAAELQPLSGEPGFEPLRALHAALIEDLAGDTAAAGRDYQAALGDQPPGLRMVQLVGNFLERTGQAAEAERLYRRFAESSGAETGIALHVATGAPPARLVGDARAGLGEALFDLAGIVAQAESPEVALLSIRLALEVRPEFPLATLMLGDLDRARDRPADALRAYRTIDPASPYGWAARLRSARALDEDGQTEAAETLLRSMAAERPAEAEPLIELGNVLRGHDQFRPAADAYGQALARLGPGAGAGFWSLYYSRGIALERAGDWPPAEADLRKALALRPDQADVLNYLGYSMVDRGIHLAEALTMIKQAVDLRPKDGFIEDSLGWAYFRLGKFTDAEDALEKAVELRPGDAEINDHLGDAYWQGGRREEARLQWRRALSLGPAADLARSIQAKLDHPPALRAGPGAVRKK